MGTGVVRTWIVGVALAAALGGMDAAWGDIIELKDGRKFSGRAVTQGTRVLITTEDGATLETTTANVASIKQVGSLSKDELAATEWKRVAAASKNAADLQSAIAMHERYIRQYGESPSGPEALRSLEHYRKLGESGGLKYKGEWISKDDFEQIRKGWKESAAAADAFYRAGQLKEALQAVAVVLAKEPQNQEALAVAGMAAYRSNNMALAARYFALLGESIPASVMGAHNQAVLYAQKKDNLNATKFYLRALQIMPSNRLLLDNVAELVHGYTEDKNLPAYKQLLQAYEQAQAKKEAEMLKEKHYRWGSTWVTEEQLSKLTKSLDDVRAEMRVLDARYRSVRQTLPQVEDQVARARLDVQSLESAVMNLNLNAAGPAGAGGPLRTELERGRLVTALENARLRLTALEGQRNKLQADLTEIQSKAPGLKAKLAEVEPQFTGIQRIMDLGEAENPPPFVAVKVKYEPEQPK